MGKQYRHISSEDRLKIHQLLRQDFGIQEIVDPQDKLSQTLQIAKATGSYTKKLRALMVPPSHKISFSNNKLVLMNETFRRLCRWNQHYISSLFKHSCEKHPFV